VEKWFWLHLFLKGGKVVLAPPFLKGGKGGKGGFFKRCIY